ncbi:MAG: 23S rRNA (pseudouridine(1915)-N(3))-methyltransferase RlmH [Brevinematales bacterium]|nr:23S rRNA (pseudouridine(1915)-N(3))-methyltransferase RlmH [Brevinematales bacterium]
MFVIRIISVGKIHYKELIQTISRFKNMISRFARVEEIEIGESRKNYPRNLEEEGTKILHKIKDEDFIVLLDRDGKEITSEDFAYLIKRNMDIGRNITFIIGGHQGVDVSVKTRSNFTLSFSKMTFGHNVFRVMLYEQIYRAFSIISGTPYHK